MPAPRQPTWARRFADGLANGGARVNGIAATAPTAKRTVLAKPARRPQSAGGAREMCRPFQEGASGWAALERDASVARRPSSPPSSARSAARGTTPSLAPLASRGPGADATSAPAGRPDAMSSETSTSCATARSAAVNAHTEAADPSPRRGRAPSPYGGHLPCLRCLGSVCRSSPGGVRRAGSAGPTPTGRTTSRYLTRALTRRSVGPAWPRTANGRRSANSAWTAPSAGRCAEQGGPLVKAGPRGAPWRARTSRVARCEQKTLEGRRERGTGSPRSGGATHWPPTRAALLVGGAASPR